MANIGENIGGGILFYTGATSLVAAIRDIDIPVDWGLYGSEVIGTSTAIGTGQANTTAIINAFTGYTAAKACNDLVLSGQSDWYLPSKDELAELYASGRTFLSGLDNYDNYWSSSQSSPHTAHMQYFLNGTQSSLGRKNQSYKIRPIRTL